MGLSVGLAFRLKLSGATFRLNLSGASFQAKIEWG